VGQFDYVSINSVRPGAADVAAIPSLTQPIADAQYVVDKDGKKTAVVIPIRQYVRLLEDLHDLAAVAERRTEPVISLTELKQRLQADAGL
jgi:hypothetical protein